MTYAQEIERLKEISTYYLPLNTAESGLSAVQIKEKTYAGLFFLLELLENVRQNYASADAGLAADITALSNSITSLANRVGVIEIDAAAIEVLQSQVGGLATLVAGHTSTIATIQTAINTINANITTLRSDIVNGVISSYKAIRDGSGNVITTTYATKAALALTDAEITKIKNGTTTVGKASSDKDGNIIDQTYVKKSQIVNDTSSTATNAPLSAYQGKVLRDLITGIQTLLASNDTDLDTIQEIVTYIKNNKTLINNITSSKVNVSDIIDGLTSEIANKPLSAKQGYILKGLIDDLADEFSGMKDDFDELDDKWDEIYEDYHTTAVKVNELSGGIVALTYSDECEQVIDNNDGTLDLVFN